MRLLSVAIASMTGAIALAGCEADPPEPPLRDGGMESARDTATEVPEVVDAGLDQEQDVDQLDRLMENHGVIVGSEPIRSRQVYAARPDPVPLAPTLVWRRADLCPDIRDEWRPTLQLGSLATPLLSASSSGTGRIFGLVLVDALDTPFATHRGVWSVNPSNPDDHTCAERSDLAPFESGSLRYIDGEIVGSLRKPPEGGFFSLSGASDFLVRPYTDPGVTWTSDIATRNGHVLFVFGGRWVGSYDLVGHELTWLRRIPAGQRGGALVQGNGEVYFANGELHPISRDGTLGESLGTTHFGALDLGVSLLLTNGRTFTVARGNNQGKSIDAGYLVTTTSGIAVLLRDTLTWYDHSLEIQARLEVPQESSGLVALADGRVATVNGSVGDAISASVTVCSAVSCEQLVIPNAIGTVGPPVLTEDGVLVFSIGPELIAVKVSTAGLAATPFPRFPGGNNENTGGLRVE